MDKGKVNIMFENPNTRAELERLLVKTLTNKLSARQEAAEGSGR